MIKIYNTLTKNKDEFKTLEDKKVKMYVCGPTVYNYLHIGNFRGPIFYNFVRNWLEFKNYDVNFVFNYTDVDDKIINKAKQEGVEISEITKKFIAAFEKDYNRLGLQKHNHNPRVSEYMDQIIDFIKGLIANGKAYAVAGEVFYSVDSFDGYGKLSGKKLDELEAGNRVEIHASKRNPQDFVLWKPSDVKSAQWDSPWGMGRPGWHIECSAMSKAILGETIDIHGGGIDLIFPHHENEIAQSEGLTGLPYCNCWMHNNFINLKDEKMSKSLGNIITGREFMDLYTPETLKFLMLSNHYRTQLNVNDERISSALSGLERFYSAIALAESVMIKHPLVKEVAMPNLVERIEQADKKIDEAINDDFNTVELFSELFEVTRFFNNLNILNKKDKSGQAHITAKLYKDWIRKIGKTLSLFQEESNKMLQDLNDVIVRAKKIDVVKVEQLIAKRKEARASKDFAESDKLRDELDSMGIMLFDGLEPQWSCKKEL